MAGSTPASLTAKASKAGTTEASKAGTTEAPRAGTTAALSGGAPSRPPRLLGAEAWRRFRRHKLALAGAIILAIIVVGVLVGPWAWRVPINEIDFTARLNGPSAAHPFGTDDLGQDLLARMLYGGRISVAVGFAAMLIAIVVGVI